MTIEQKPELNRFIYSDIPFTWPKRWRAFKPTLPIWAFIFLCIAEMAILQAWFANRLSWDFISTLAGGLVGFFFVFWGIIELHVWFDHRSKRILRVEGKRLVVSPAKHQYLRLKSVTKFQFEPIAENPALTKLSVFVYFSKRVPEAIRFKMAVEDPAKIHELIQMLETKRQTMKVSFKIVVLDRPEPLQVTTLSFLPMSVFFTGFYLFLHGLPLLGIALLPGKHNSSNSDFNPEQVAKLGSILADHFSSADQLRHFYLGVGIILTVAGFAMLFWGLRLTDRKPDV